MNFILNILFKFVNETAIANAIAKAQSALLRWAIKTNRWGRIKSVATTLNAYNRILLDAVDDDDITDEEVEKIAKAIEENMPVADLLKLVQSLGKADK